MTRPCGRDPASSEAGGWNDADILRAHSQLRDSCKTLARWTALIPLA